MPHRDICAIGDATFVAPVVGPFFWADLHPLLLI